MDAEALDGIRALSVSGELDQATAPELEDALRVPHEGDDGSVFVDLSSCEFIDSTGLSLLVEAQRRLSENGHRLVICCPRSEVRRLLELTGIDTAIGIFDTREEALAALS